MEGAPHQALDYLGLLGVKWDIVVKDGIRYRMYAADEDFLPVAHTKLAHLKFSALRMCDTMQ